MYEKNSQVDLHLTQMLYSAGHISRQGLLHVIKPSEVETYRGYMYYNYSNIQLRQLHGLHLQTAVMIYPG